MKLPRYGTELFNRSCACLVDLHLLTLAEAMASGASQEAKDAEAVRCDLIYKCNCALLCIQ